MAEETSLQALFPAPAESQRRQHQRERPQRRPGRPEAFTAAREGAEGKLGRLGGSYPWLLLTGTRAPSSTCASQWRWWGAGGGYYGTVHADNVQGPAVAILGRVMATVSREELGWGDGRLEHQLLLMSELPLTQGGVLVTSPKAKAFVVPSSSFPGSMSS